MCKILHFLTLGYPSVRSLQTLSPEKLCFEVNMNYTNKGVIPVMEYSILKNLFMCKFMDLVAYSNKRAGGVIGSNPGQNHVIICV